MFLSMLTLAHFCNVLFDGFKLPEYYDLTAIFVLKVSDFKFYIARR